MSLHIFWSFEFSHCDFQRITIPEILENQWFKIDYTPAEFQEDGASTLDDVDAVFNESAVTLAIWT